MNWFKSVWMRLRKSNNLPGNEVLIPMVPVSLEEKPAKIKRKVVRKVKVSYDQSNNS
jgi:hypothetical protein